MVEADGTTLEKVEVASQKAGAVKGGLLLLSEAGVVKVCLPTSAGGDLGCQTNAGALLVSLHCGSSSPAPCPASWHYPASQLASPCGSPDLADRRPAGQGEG